jgi:hypothetical protein
MGNQLKLLRFSPCYKSGGEVNQRKRVGMTYLPTIEVKNVNRCFRHLLITFKYCRWWGLQGTTAQP